ncbi:glycosyl transferase family 2 [Chthoniobacter flavus]|nr:glycosyltransferase [Chthoniobacter flavus]TCO90472.1 glycosyl transferase family 2 [Chthoniobacter flavus]
MFAPVVLFAYNRPDHVRATLESLAANAGAGETPLYIHCDGAKPQAGGEERERVNQVRKVIREKQWCGRVTIVESETNRGLADSIVQGVQDVLTRHGSVIVLEDDLLLAPGFLCYMNEALRCYENDADVMHVSGYMFPVSVELPETFFLQLTSCWGWATWRRAFTQFEPDARKLLAGLEERGLVRTFNFEEGYDYAGQLRANAVGTLRTWAVRWYASVLLRGGLALFPRQTLVENTGFDGSGANCKSLDQRFGNEMGGDIRVMRSPLQESAAAREAVRRALQGSAAKPSPPSFLTRWKKSFRTFTRMK